MDERKDEQQQKTTTKKLRKERANAEGEEKK